MSKDLKDYCKQNEIELESCTRKGFWLMSWKNRPSCESLLKVFHAIKDIGYDYLQDGQDSTSYFICVGKSNLLKKRS